jgi:hypothetical protein
MVKALVASNIIQLVCLVGKGRLKERCGLEPRTNFFFFSFKESAKTSAVLIRVRIIFENIRYFFSGCLFFTVAFFVKFCLLFVFFLFVFCVTATDS